MRSLDYPTARTKTAVKGAKRKVYQMCIRDRAWEEMSLEEHMKIYEDQGIGRKDAMKMVAKDRGISKREVYQGLLD